MTPRQRQIGDEASPTGGSGLAGIRVLDLSRVLAGPFCTQMLADLGAAVWKVEPPWGDETRRWGPPYRGGESAYYLATNRGKQGLAIDLGQREGRAIVRELAVKADVVIENFKVDDAARYGLDYEDVSADNPGVVYASITGYGRSGPRAADVGYDLALQGMTGLMAVTGEPGRPPVRVGVALIDVMTGMMTAVGILSALLERRRSGRGQHLDIPLFDVGVMAMANIAQSHLLTGERSTRFGSGHPHIVPYQAFQTDDGWLLIAVGSNDQFRSLCKILDLPGLADDDRFATNERRVQNREALIDLLSPPLLDGATGDWVRRCRDAGVPAAPVQDVGAALTDAHATARNLVWTVEHPTIGRLPLVGNVLQHLSRTPARAAGHPPLLGEHTRTVLTDVLAIDAARLEDLEASGAIASPHVQADKGRQAASGHDWQIAGHGDGSPRVHDPDL